MPQPGDVFVVKNYAFEDGKQKDKWFVVLNASDLDKPCLTLITTSQTRWYQNAMDGCNQNHKCFFIPATWNTCFPIDTYIQLPKIIDFPASALLRNGMAGRIEFKNPLAANRFAQLKSCLPKFREDISDAHWDLIYKANK